METLLSGDEIRDEPYQSRRAIRGDVVYYTL